STPSLSAIALDGREDCVRVRLARIIPFMPSPAVKVLSSFQGLKKWVGASQPRAAGLRPLPWAKLSRPFRAKTVALFRARKRMGRGSRTQAGGCVTLLFLIWGALSPGETLSFISDENTDGSIEGGVAGFRRRSSAAAPESVAVGLGEAVAAS